MVNFLLNEGFRDNGVLNTKVPALKFALGDTKVTIWFDCEFTYTEPGYRVDGRDLQELVFAMKHIDENPYAEEK